MFRLDVLLWVAKPWKGARFHRLFNLSYSKEPKTAPWLCFFLCATAVVRCIVLSPQASCTICEHWHHWSSWPSFLLAQDVRSGRGSAQLFRPTVRMAVCKNAHANIWPTNPRLQERLLRPSKDVRCFAAMQRMRNLRLGAICPFNRTLNFAFHV